MVIASNEHETQQQIETEEFYLHFYLCHSLSYGQNYPIERDALVHSSTTPYALRRVPTIHSDRIRLLVSNSWQLYWAMCSRGRRQKMKEKNIRINSTVLHRVDSLRRVKLWSFVSYSFLRRKFISPLAQYASQHRNAFQRMVSKVTTPICNVHWANVGIQAGRLSCTFAIATITPSTLCSAAILWTHIFDATKAIHNNDVQGIVAAVVACYLSR